MTEQNEACEQAASDALEFVMPKLQGIRDEKGLVGVWCNGFRSGWASSGRASPSDPVAWQVKAPGSDNWLLCNIPEMIDQLTADGYEVSPLFDSAATVIDGEATSALRAAETRIAALEAALRPFSETPDDWTVNWVNTARAALSQPQPSEVDGNKPS